MVDLQISQDGMAVKPFQVREHQSLPQVYLETKGEASIQYHRSIDGVTFSPVPETVTFDKHLHDSLYGVKVGEFIKITSNAPLLNAKIVW